MPRCPNSCSCSTSQSQFGSRTLWPRDKSSSPLRPALSCGNFKPSCNHVAVGHHNKKRKNTTHVSVSKEERLILMNLIAALALSSTVSTIGVAGAMEVEEQETLETVTSASTLSSDENDKESEGFYDSSDEEWDTDEEEEDEDPPVLAKPYMTVVKPRTYHRFGYQNLRKYRPSSHIQRRHLYAIYEVLNEDECDDDTDLYPPCVPDPRIVTWSLHSRFTQDHQQYYSTGYNHNGLHLTHHNQQHTAETGQDYEPLSRKFLLDSRPSKDMYHHHHPDPSRFLDDGIASKHVVQPSNVYATAHNAALEFDPYPPKKSQQRTATHMLYSHPIQTPYTKATKSDIVVGDGMVVKHNYGAPALLPSNGRHDMNKLSFDLSGSGLYVQTASAQTVCAGPIQSTGVDGTTGSQQIM